MRRLALAFVLLARAVPAAADDALALAREGAAHLEAGRASEALAAFERALRLAPGRPEFRRGAATAHFEIGRAALEARDLEGAITRFHLALGYWQEEPELYLWLGVAYHRSEEYLAARNEFQHVLKSRPDDPVALAYTGFAWYREDRFDQAEAFLARAVDRSPADLQLARWLERVRAERRVAAEYRTLVGDRFVVRYPDPGDLDRARLVLDLLDEAWTRVGTDLGLHPDATLPVFVYRGADFQRVTGASPWIQGLFDGRIRLSLDQLGDADEARRLVHHEYAHALLGRIAPGAPAWLEEGLAQLEEGRPADPARALVREAIARGEWIPLAELSEPFHSTRERGRVELGYAQSFAFVHDVAARYGRGTLVRVLSRSGRGTPLSEAFRAETGSSLEDLVAGWRRSLE